MAVTTYIIDSEDFINRADLSLNIATPKLLAQIGPTQEIYVIKILCREFYDEVLAVVAGTTTSALITTLLPFIKDFLVYKTYREYIIGANVLSSAAGLRTQTSDSSAPASDKQLAEIKGQAKERANFYQDQLVNFLILNEDDYPTWKDSVCNCVGITLNGKRTLNRRRALNANMFSSAGSRNNRVDIEFT